jgi:hypothetical protein
VPDQARQTPRTGCAAQRCIVDARVDPFNEQGKVGPSSSNRFLGDCFAVTLQNTYSVAETLGPPATGPTDMPLVTLPSASAPTSVQVFGNERSVKFNILPTGTTLGAGPTSVSNDSITIRSAPSRSSPPGYHRSDRFRPNYQQQEHQRRV